MTMNGMERTVQYLLIHISEIIKFIPMFTLKYFQKISL